MRILLTSLYAAALLAMAGAAEATVVIGAFSGTITGGSANGSFGYAVDANADLTGQTITGTFRYDTRRLLANCAGATAFFGCFVGPGVTITETVNGVTATFISAPARASGLPYNSAEGGVLLYNLSADTANLRAHKILGDPSTVYDQYDVALAFQLPLGAIQDATNPVLAYDGPNVGPGGIYGAGGQFFGPNQTEIHELTATHYTQQTLFYFNVDHVSFGSGAVVPEPASWALMIFGFGAVGARLRRFRAASGLA